MNKKTTQELLEFIHTSILLIKKRCRDIQSGDDFLKSDANLLKFDASLMRLQTIGEAIKNLLKRDEAFMVQVAPREYWSMIVRFRDIVLHHYMDIQADEIFEICINHLDELESKILALKERI